MSLLIALYRFAFHSKYSQSELAEMLLISRASLYRSENFTFRYELGDAPAPVEIPQDPPPKREPTLKEVLAATRREVMGDMESPAMDSANFPYAPQHSKPKPTALIDSIETSEGEAIPDKECLKRFVECYPTTTVLFNWDSMSRIVKAWRNNISAGYTGEAMVHAVATAKDSALWREKTGKFIPNAERFLVEKDRWHYYLPQSFNLESNLRKLQPKQETYADVDLSILANASCKDGNTDELDALTPMPVPNLDELRFSNVVASLYEWSTLIALRNDRDADYDPIRLRSLTEYLVRQFADGSLQSMFPQPIPLGYGVRATISELNALLASVRSSRIGYPNSLGEIER